MARRAARIIEPEFADPIAEVIAGQRENTAEELSDILAELGSVVTADSNIKVYKEADRGGEWAYCKTLEPPLQTEGLLDELRQEWGGGRYFIRVFADKKIVTTRRLTIAGDKNPARPQAQPDKTAELFPLMLQMTQKSSGDMATMLTAMMQQQQASMQMSMQQQMAASDRQMQMMMGMMTAVLGGQSKPEQLLAAFAPLLAQKSGGGMDETIKGLVALKELINPGEGGGSDDMFTTAMKTFGPAVASALAKPAETPPPNPGPPMLAAPHGPPPRLPPMRPGPQYVPRDGAVAITPTATPEASQGSPDPVLAAIREDVLFFAKRGTDPALAAEAVLEQIDKAGITDEQVTALVVRFTASADWLSDLAAAGIDLRSRPEWAQQFLSELVAQYTDNHGGDTDSARPGGGSADPDEDEGIEP